MVNWGVLPSICAHRTREITHPNHNRSCRELTRSNVGSDLAFLRRRLGLVELVQRGRTEGIQGAGNCARGHGRG